MPDGRCFDVADRPTARHVRFGVTVDLGDEIVKYVGEIARQEIPRGFIGPVGLNMGA
jgi:hypothetical protein